MTSRDIICIGASAGGVEVLTGLARSLPPDLPATVLIALHISPFATGYLPAVLNRAGPLPAAFAEPGQPLAPGRIYVAPPDHHLLVGTGTVELSRGPRENRARPAIDPLFRSAARACGRRVIGVLLSGVLGDGSAGLLMVKAHGGVAVVQDLDDAPFGEMPRRAIQAVPVDYVVPAAELGPLLVRLVHEGMTEEGRPTMDAADTLQSRVIDQDLQGQARNERAGQLAPIVCPECGGTLWQAPDPTLVRFQCHTGHHWSSEVLLVQKSEALEQALWACMRLLTEKALLTRQIAARARAGGSTLAADQLEESARLDEHYQQLMRQSILESMPNPIMQAHLVTQALAGLQPPPAGEVERTTAPRPADQA